jgi:hypothetical protein
MTRLALTVRLLAERHPVETVWVIATEYGVAVSVYLFRRTAGLRRHNYGDCLAGGIAGDDRAHGETASGWLLVVQVQRQTTRRFKEIILY